MIKVTSLTESELRAIGEAFADFEYAPGERGMRASYASRDDVRDYICDYARAAMKAGRLYSTGERHEAFIAFRYSEEKMPAAAGLMLVRSLVKHLTFWGTLRFMKQLSAAGQSFEDKLKKAKKPYVVVGMVAVTKPYQGQGYMRKVLDLAFEAGRAHGCPVILETDAMLKRDKYVHLGMKCVGERKLDEGSYLYDLAKEF